MTRYITLSLLAALALTPGLGSAQTLIQRHGGGDPVARGLVASPAGPAAQGRVGVSGLAQGGTNASAADNTPFCGINDVFYWYEEDENGNEIEGTRQYGCTD